MGFSTDAIHVGQEPDPATGAIVVPIYQTSTFVQEELGKHKGYEYARTSNPTRAALECNLAALERGQFGFAFASGMAAINAVMSLFKAGDHIVAGHKLYGGTFRLFERVLRDSGLSFTYANTCRLGEVEKALDQEVERLQKEWVGEHELAKAKNQLEASFIYGQDSLFFQAMLLAQHEIVLNWEAIDDYLPSIRKVTAGDIQRVARQYLTPDNRTAGVLIPLPPKEGTLPPAGSSGRERIVR